ncbi:hypothetical protein [Serratia rubidaea]|uniref:hypothetical protein n=1 Tax=Serratia rubidaea TaxID=61652 RepID=UPI000AC2D994|nr:hypothetical protein [Serratia rubidaea]
MKRGALLLLLAAAPLSATPRPDYQAVYHILPLRGDTPIGEYRVSQRWQPDSNSYLQQASIQFRWRVLLSSHQYRYRDEVRYGVDGGFSYRIEEDNDGRTRQVSGGWQPGAQALTLTVRRDQQPPETLTVAKATFDFPLFALRFPKPCAPQQAGTRSSQRMLMPIDGEVVQTESHYVGVGELTLPGDGVATPGLCQIVSSGQRRDANHRTWINRDGYLAYEISADYRLRLVPEASHLPPNVQEKGL